MEAPKVLYQFKVYEIRVQIHKRNLFLDFHLKGSDSKAIVQTSFVTDLDMGIQTTLLTLFM